MAPYTVYILESSCDGRHYIGCTEDLTRRLEEHNSGENRSTRGKGPWRVAYQEVFETFSEARGREKQVKRMKSRSYIAALISPSSPLESK